MKRFDEDQFKLSLHQAPWNIAFVFDDIDDVVYAWEDTFNNILDAHCPWREKCVKRTTQPPWMTESVVKQLHIRDHLLKVARHSDNLDDWTNYRTARNKAVSALHSANRQFYNNTFEENRNNTRAIWKTIKTLSGSKINTREVKNLNVDGRDMEDSMEMAECFNAYFSTIAGNLRDGLR